jgi:hypothetical protein
MTDRIKQLELQVKRLQEAVGAWKRKANGAIAFEYVSQRHEKGRHFIGVALPGLPADLDHHEVQEYVRDIVIPRYYPYEYHNIYSSKRFGGWVATLVRPDDMIDMGVGPASVQD